MAPPSFGAAAHDSALGSEPPAAIQSSGSGHFAAGPPQMASLETGPGSRVGLEARFDIHEKLGEGGMGVVYRVTDLQLQRDVALKVIRPAVADGDRATRRFLTEARITGRLEHPAVPPVHAVGELPDGRPFLVMKVLSGISLDAAIKQRQEGDPEARTMRDLIVVLARVCEAVACAHSQRVIHRDLKPENVQLGELGEVLVLDWGLARAIGGEASTADTVESNPAASDGTSHETGDERSRVVLTVQQGEEAGLTLHGAVLGTPGYMPPEQAGGERVDERADVFALGAILTEILTGERPVEGSNATNRIVATLKGKIRGPRDIDPRVDRELDSLARAAMEIDLADRLDSAAEMARELRRWLAGEEVRCHRSSAVERLLRSARRRPGRVLALAGGLALVLILGLLVTGLQAARRSARLAESEAATAKLQQQQAEAAESRTRAEAKRFNRTSRLLSELTRLAARRGGRAELDPVVESLLEVNQASPEFLLTLASILRIGRATESADRLLARAARDFPEAEILPDILFERVLIAFDDEREVAGRLEEFARLAKQRGLKSALALFVEGTVLRRRGLTARALQSYDEAERRGGRNHPWLYTNRGLLHLSEGRMTQARRDLERAVELKPDSGRAWVNMGLYQLHARDAEAAYLAFERAIHLQPGRADYYARRARALRQLGRLKEALAATGEALRLDPGCVEGLNERARILGSLQRLPDALALIDGAMEREPLRDNLVLLRCRATLLNRLGRHEEAVTVARAVAGRGERSIADRRLLGLMLVDAGRVPEAVKLARETAAQHPGDVEALSLLAEVLVASRDGPAAARVFDQIFKIDPDNVVARLGFADLLSSSRQYDRAVREFSAVLTVRPRQLDALAGRAHARRRLGDLAGAMADIDRLCELAPKSRQAAWGRTMRGKIRAEQLRRTGDREGGS